MLSSSVFVLFKLGWSSTLTLSPVSRKKKTIEPVNYLKVAISTMRCCVRKPAGSKSLFTCTAEAAKTQKTDVANMFWCDKLAFAHVQDESPLTAVSVHLCKVCPTLSFHCICCLSLLDQHWKCLSLEVCWHSFTSARKRTLKARVHRRYRLYLIYCSMSGRKQEFCKLCTLGFSVKPFVAAFTSLFCSSWLPSCCFATLTLVFAA